MSPAERHAVLALLTPRLPANWFTRVFGQALVLQERNKPGAVDCWYLDCPSYFGSTGRRQIGRMEHAPGFEAPLSAWTPKSARFVGTGWEARMVDALLIAMFGDEGRA